MKPFNLEAALRGEPVWHIAQHSPITDISRLKNKVVYQIKATGDSVFSCLLDGTHSTESGLPVLAMAPKTRTLYANLWDSPSFHYTTYESRLAAMESSRVSPNSHKAYKKLNPEPIAITVEE